ncbi:MAG: hypothetical protein ACRCZ9_08325 [Fusobacteriaceae bacterium]
MNYISNIDEHSYYSECAENTSFIREVESFNNVLENSDFLVAESSFLSTFKSFIMKIYNWIKNLIKKIIAFVTGKKSGGGGGGGGGGGSSSAKDTEIKKKAENMSGVSEIIETLKDEGIPKTELVEHIIQESEKIIDKEALEGIADTGRIRKAVEDLMTNYSKSKNSSYIKSLAKTTLMSTSLSVPVFNSSLCEVGGKLHDPKIVANKLYTSLLIYSAGVLDDMRQTTLGVHLDTRKRYDVMFKSTSILHDVVDFESILKAGNVSTMKDVIGHMFTSQSIVDMAKAEGDDVLKFFKVNMDTSGAFPELTLLESTEIFHKSLFPFIGELKDMKFDGVPLAGYFNEDINTLMKEITSSVDVLMKQLNDATDTDGTSENIKVYNNKKETLVSVMKIMVNLSNLMNYGENIYRPTVENLLEISQKKMNRLINLTSAGVMSGVENVTVVNAIERKIKISSGTKKKIVSTLARTKMKDKKTVAIEIVKEEHPNASVDTNTTLLGENPWVITSVEEFDILLNVMKTTTYNIKVPKTDSIYKKVLDKYCDTLEREGAKIRVKLLKAADKGYKDELSEIAVYGMMKFVERDLLPLRDGFERAKRYGKSTPEMLESIIDIDKYLSGIGVKKYEIDVELNTKMNNGLHDVFNIRKYSTDITLDIGKIRYLDRYAYFVIFSDDDMNLSKYNIKGILEVCTPK